MPMFEYECTECNKYQERIVKIGADNPACQECNGETKKLISAPSGNGNSAHGLVRSTGKVKRS